MAAELEDLEAGEETNEVEKTRDEDEDEDDHSTEKRGKHSKKHKHKHSKKHKHKHKKRKHKKRSPSRSRSKSSSRSRSRSPDSNENLEGETAKSDVADEADVKVISSEENGIVKLESQNKTMSLGEGTKYSTFEEFTLAEVENLSFKLTKSPPSSVTCSPSSTPVNETEVAKVVTKIPDVSKLENKVNLGFPMKIGSFPKSRSKSPDVSEEMLGGKRSSSPSDSEIKSRSKSPLDHETLKISQSPSDPKKSKSPQSKIKKVSRSHSRSRSRSRTKTQSRKSTSKSPKRHPKKKYKSSWSSRSRSRSKSRSRSRNKHRHSTKSKSRSRSPQRHKPRGRSRSRSPSLSRKKSRKRERSLGSSRKSRSRSPRKKSRGSHDSKTRGRSRSPAYRDSRSKRETFYDRKRDYSSRSRRSRSHENRYSRRSRSVTPPKSHRRRSHSRSPRRRRSRSPRRERSRSPRRERHRYQSRSRSLSSHRRRSRSHSRSKDGHGRRSRSKSKEKNDSEEKKGGEKSSGEAPVVITNLNTNKPTAQDLVGKAPTVSDPSNKRSLAQLTEFCKKLTEARGIEIEGNATENPTEEEEDDVSVEISHPFLVAPKKDITIPPVILPPLRPLAFPLVSSDKPLTEQFPVSCGTKHHEKEQEEVSVGQVIPYVDGSAHQPQQVFMPPQNQEKLDISGLVVKRMEAQRRLQADPNDLDAMLSLQEVEMKLNSWCQSNVKPGQFTGQLAKNMMPKEKMNTGYQAWAKKDMFHNLNPISGGVGMKLLQKMGWEPGQVLGKRGQGMVEPIALTVKVDRKGLSSNTEKPVGKKGGGSKQIIDLQGKHPISSLQEYCARRKWQVPEFTLIFDEGPPHSKQFLFKVAVNGYEYQHPVVSSNKKHAKAQAAVAALKGLGLVPVDADY